MIRTIRSGPAHKRPPSLPRQAPLRQKTAATVCRVPELVSRRLPSCRGRRAFRLRELHRRLQLDREGERCRHVGACPVGELIPQGPHPVRAVVILGLKSQFRSIPRACYVAMSGLGLEPRGDVLRGPGTPRGRHSRTDHDDAVHPLPATPSRRRERDVRYFFFVAKRTGRTSWVTGQLARRGSA